MKKIPFYVINWNFNTKKVEYYDIMPYLLKCYKGQKTKKDIKEFILHEALCQWWSRCEYEVIIQQWPKQDKCEEKIDIYDQVEANIDAIVNIFMQNL